MHAIIFDIGNVLVKYDHARTLAAVAATFGVSPATLDNAYADIGPAFGLGQLQPDQVCSMLNQRFGAAIALTEFATAFCAGLARDDDALAYADTLQVDGELFVGAISNTNAIHVAWLDAHVPELSHFELVIMSNEVALLKPDPEIFALAQELLAVPADHVLYIDDSAENVAAAQSIGMKSFTHVDWVTTRSRIEAWRRRWRSPTSGA
ncbi:MAG TPA: HAD-IA family hydrolase [Chloroflexi bacterium]|nr:HAD-IA family hydrolase [Chloroflexota bacterium]